MQSYLKGEIKPFTVHRSVYLIRYKTPNERSCKGNRASDDRYTVDYSLHWQNLTRQKRT